MILFANLLERLAFTPGRNAKLALLRRYFAQAPEPDRGFALAALTGELKFPTVKAKLIRELAAGRCDPVLFEISRDFVGNFAETVALIWPEAPTNQPAPRLSDVIATIAAAPKAELPEIVAGWLDASDATVRLALLKLITGGLRIDASVAGLLQTCDDAAGQVQELGATSPHDPMTIDAVLMYAQRGQGYTLGLWRGDELLPVGKAESDLGEDMQKIIDKFVRENTTNRFGPVREVARGLVLEVAFDAVLRSTRRKSGVTLRFPRIVGLKADKPAHAADQLESLVKLIDG